jgi:hypothetical protein
MLVEKRKILIESFIDRSNDPKKWGTITSDNLYINIFLTQNIENIGLFTDIENTSVDINNILPVDYTILTDKLSLSGLTYPFMYTSPTFVTNGLTETETISLRLPFKTESEYYNSIGLNISGKTDSKIEDLRSYNGSNPYIIGFDINKKSYTNYNDVSIDGINRVLSIGEPRRYVFDAEDDFTIGTSNQRYGLYYQDYTGLTNNVNINGNNLTIPLTTINYIGEAQNKTNTSLSAITKQEFLFGIITPPEIKNDVFIERGVTNIMDNHLRLSEIKDLGELVKYGNGFYKINKE